LKWKECPDCNGTGKVPDYPITGWTTLELAEEIHRLLWEELDKVKKDPQGTLLSLAYELKSKLRNDC